MRYMTGPARFQILLLPPAIDDYVGPDNAVRFIEAFVNGLDLGQLGFSRAMPERTGRPGYHPADLLKLYIYGYLNRVRSSRRLETETHRNLEVIWLMRQLRPDFKTIADFRRENRTAFKGVFRQFVRLCADLDLYGREMLAVDGTRLKAVNNRDNNFTKAKLAKQLSEIDQKLDTYFNDMSQADRTEAGTDKTQNVAAKIERLRKKQAKLRATQQQLKETGEDQISLTDPDARAMHPGSRIGVGYNAQIAVDAKHHLIAEQEVHNKVSDQGLLTETVIAAKEVLGVDEISVVADGGYYQVDDLAACEDANITPYVPAKKPKTYKDGDRFGKTDFIYDVKQDAYICPGGSHLTKVGRGTEKGKPYTVFAKRSACTACGIKSKCTAAKNYRRIHRYDNEAVLDRVKARMAAWPQAMALRQRTVEHPFGSIKHWMGHRDFLTRRLPNVRAEFSLTALAYNIRRAITLVGVEGLIKAAQA
jgi:transposase